MKIRRLDPQVITKIAAGEVVTGVHSVVKELVENSLDAAAKKVVVELVGGGKSQIVVADDGEGMEKEDLLLCYQPHTTSKISTFEDIYNLATFGFRGEALHSICAVSKVSIRSRPKNFQVGHEIEVVAGHLVYEKPISIDQGTTVVVKDLFFNVPARRKFLKSAAVEARMATEMFERFALSKPEIHFVLTRDQEIVYNLPGVDFLSRVKQIFSDLPTSELVQLNNIHGEMKLEGVIALPSVLRNVRSTLIFVNERFVINQMIVSAIYSAYSEYLERGKHPFVVLKLYVPQKDLDVNVHPQKLEVKFTNEEGVFLFVRDSLKNLLRKSTARVMKIEKVEYNRPKATFESPSEILREHAPTLSTQSGYRFPADRKIDLKPQEKLKMLKPVDFKVLGLIRGRYVVVETQDSLLIMDFHAAHERLIYEKILSNLHNMPSGQLLFEISLQMRKSDLELFEKSTILKAIGFDYRIEDDKIVVQRIPKWLDQNDVKDFFISAVDELKLVDLQDSNEIMKNLIADIACKNALRTRDKLDKSQAEELFRQVVQAGLSNCPHGRPIFYSISYDDLDKFFERT